MLHVLLSVKYLKTNSDFPDLIESCAYWPSAQAASLPGEASCSYRSGSSADKPAVSGSRGDRARGSPLERYSL